MKIEAPMGYSEREHNITVLISNLRNIKCFVILHHHFKAKSMDHVLYMSIKDLLSFFSLDLLLNKSRIKARTVLLVG